MEIIDITEENVEAYVDLLGEDMTENMGRTFYRGLAVQAEGNTTPDALMIWELINSEKTDKDTESAIRFLQIREEEAGQELFDAYRERIASVQVKRSNFVIPAKKGALERTMLKQAGFGVKLMEGDLIVVKVGEFEKLPLMKIRKDSPNIISAGDVAVRQFRKGIWRCIEAGFTGICEDLSYLPMNWFEPTVSCFSAQGEDINGFLLFHKHPSGALSLQLMAALGKEYQQTLVSMMRHSIIAMEENYAPETRVLLDRHNQASLQLSEKLFPRGFGRPMYMGRREENEA